MRFLLQVLTRLRISFFFAVEMVTLKEKLLLEGRFAHCSHQLFPGVSRLPASAWMLCTQDVLSLRSRSTVAGKHHNGLGRALSCSLAMGIDTMSVGKGDLKINATKLFTPMLF